MPLISKDLSKCSSTDVALFYVHKLLLFSFLLGHIKYSWTIDFSITELLQVYELYALKSHCFVELMNYFYCLINGPVL